MILICMNTYAASSATLVLTGNVPKKLDISIDVNAVNLDLSSSKTDFKVATVTEKSNSSTGYKVSVTSANLGFLTRVGGVEKFPYSLKYGPQNISLISNSGSAINTVSQSLVNSSKDVLISYSGVNAEVMVEGNYTDTLTFSISAN